MWYWIADASYQHGESCICLAVIKTSSPATTTLTVLKWRDGTVSSENQPPTSDTDITSAEYPPLSDVLQNHLSGCEQCRQSLSQKPVPNLGGGSSLCEEWFTILRAWAKQEGEANNVVRHDEYGNYAHGSQGEL